MDERQQDKPQISAVWAVNKHVKFESDFLTFSCTSKGLTLCAVSMVCPNDTTENFKDIIIQAVSQIMCGGLWIF